MLHVGHVAMLHRRRQRVGNANDSESAALKHPGKALQILFRERIGRHVFGNFAQEDQIEIVAGHFGQARVYRKVHCEMRDVDARVIDAARGIAQLQVVAKRSRRAADVEYFYRLAARERLVGARGDGRCEQPAAGRKSRAEIAHELEHGIEQVVRDFLEIDRDAGEPELLRGLDELERGGLARRGRREHAAEQDGVELRAVEVADHREDARTVLLGEVLDDVQHLRIGRDLESRAALAEEDPFADDPVEVCDVRLERGKRVVVPVHVEAGDDRRALLAGHGFLRRARRLRHAIDRDGQALGVRGGRRRFSREGREELLPVGALAGGVPRNDQAVLGWGNSYGRFRGLEIREDRRDHEGDREAEGDEGGEDAYREGGATNGAPALAGGVEEDGVLGVGHGCT